MKWIMDSKQASLVDIIEATLQGLTELKLCARFTSADLEVYAGILMYYLSAEAGALERALSGLDHNSPAFDIALIRLHNLRLIEDETQISRVKLIAESTSEWSGEAAFALGMYFLRLKRNQEAKEMFQLAYHGLSVLGAHQKAIKALLNTVVAESRIDNKKRLMREYEIVAEKAGRVGAVVAQGTCYQNISKELHSIGALELSLKFSNQALECLKADFGTIQYYETLLQRCHVLIDLGRFKEAYLDYEMAKLASHPQTIEARKCIEILLGTQTELKMKELEPAWVTKLNQQSGETIRLTKMEMDFVDLIKTKKMPKDDLILRLHGESVDWEAAKNRFKVFLTRFRKKFPHLVAEEDGCYIIADKSIVTELEKMAQ